MKKLFKNCIDVLECDGWLLPTRFTAPERELLDEREATHIRGNAPSSVCLAFKTAATKISLDYKITGKSRPWALFDLKCDGVLVDSVALEEDDGRVEFSLSGDEDSEYRIYLPHLVIVYVRNIIADAPLLPTSDREYTWLALGDSITQGMNAKHPTSAYPSVVSEYLGCDVINAGVGGAIFDSEHLDYLGIEPKLITIAFGTNDWGIPADKLEAEILKYIDKLISLYKCRNIYAIIPIWRSDEGKVKAEMTFSAHRALVQKTLQRYPFIRFIDGYKIVPRLREFYGEDKEPRVHPTDEGFMHMSLEIIKEIGDFHE